MSRRGIWVPFANLLGGQVASALLGLLFWVVAARAAGRANVGVAAAAMSTQTLLGLLVTLGLGTHLTASLPAIDLADRRRVVLRALGLIGGAGLLVGLVLVAARPVIGGSLGTGLADGLLPLVFVVGVAGAAWTMVLDEAVLGLGRSRLQLTRNLTASSSRLVLAGVLLALGFDSPLILDLCWVAPLVLTAAGAVVALRLPAGRWRPVIDDARTHLPGALRHHLLNLALAAATQVVPVVAGLVLIATENAAFAIAWLLAASAYLPPFLLTMALFAHVANDGPDVVRAHMRRTLPIALAVSAFIVLGTLVFGRLILQVFGAAYGRESYVLLVLLVPAGLAMVVKDHLVTFWRSQRRFRPATILAGTGLVAETVTAGLGGHLDGARGLVLGWLLVLAVETAVIGPWLLLVIFRKPYSDAAAPDGSIETEPLVPLGLPGPAGSAGPGEWEVAMAATSPTRPARRGPARWRIALGVAVAALSAVLAFQSVQQARTGSTSAGFEAKTVTAPTSVAGCTPDAERGGPLIDLGLTPVTKRVFWPQSRVDRVADLASRAGANILSTRVDWPVVQPRAGMPLRWGGLDRALAAAKARSLRVRVVVEQMPAWAHDAGRRNGGVWSPPTTGAELRRWARFVGAVVAHLDGRADYLEVWPGPDRRSTWTTGPDATDFVRLLRISHRAVQRLDPGLPLISGSLATNDVGFLNRVYGVIGSSERPYDLVGVHPYGVGAPDRLGGFAGYRAVHQTMLRHGDSTVAMYLGGFSYSTAVVTDAVRAGYLRTALDVATCTSYVTALAWNPLVPTTTEPADRALTGPRYRPNLTFRALRLWTQQR